MSLVSLLAGAERDSTYLSGLLKPLAPRMSDYLVEDPFGRSVRVPRQMSGPLSGLASRAFSEIFRLCVARRMADGKRLMERLEGAQGMVALGLISLGMHRAVLPSYLDAGERYRLFIAEKMSLGEVIPAAWLMAKLSLLSSRGYVTEGARELVAPPPPLASAELSALGHLWDAFLEQKFPATLPEGTTFSPCFGQISRGMGGASCDMLLNGYFTDTTLVSRFSGAGRYASRAAALLVLPEAYRHLSGRRERYWKGTALYLARFGAMLYLEGSSFLNERRAELIRAEHGVLRRFAAVEPQGF